MECEEEKQIYSKTQFLSICLKIHQTVSCILFCIKCWKKNFDNQKIYGDTSITDGLVYVYIFWKVIDL